MEEQMDKQLIPIWNELQNTGSEVGISLYEASLQLAGSVLEYRRLMQLYECAMKTLSTRLDIINAEYNAINQRNPIHSVSSRLKKMTSIVQKLQCKGQPVNVANIEGCLRDVAGIRVICSYLDDVYDVANLLSGQPDMKVVEEKDYISNPKHNGYRSLHLIIKVPVFWEGEEHQMDVEMQLRTIAMDFWASLEHQLRYKHDIDEEADIADRLRVCAERIAKTDVDMLAIRTCIEKGKAHTTEEEDILQRFSNIDIQFK